MPRITCQHKERLRHDRVRQVNLAQNSELPEPLRVTFRDEHPLMLGSANVAARLQRLALKGSLSLQQTLPMQRKRDLLQLPQTNLSFETSLELEEESSKALRHSKTLRPHCGSASA